MEFGQLFHVIRTRWSLLAISALVVLGGALAYRLAVPGTFKAVASVIVDPRGINPVSGASTQAPGAQDAVLGTYANIARSEGIARQVVAQLPVAVTDALRTSWSSTHRSTNTGFETWAARILMRSMDVRAGGQSSHVLDISITGRDAVESATLANLYAKTLIDYSREMRVAAARKDASYFQTQAQALRGETEAAEQRLSTFQRLHGITSVDDRTDIETAKLAALNAQAVINQDLSYDSASRARQAGGAASADVLGNAVVQSLTTVLADKEARMQQLSVRLGANHPDLITARSEVEQARSALSRESRNIAASISSSSTAASSRAAALRNDSEQQRLKVIQMNSLRVEMSSLDKDVLQKRKLYEAALQRSSETGLEAGSQRGDLMLLTEAMAPEDRAGPRNAVLLPLALLVGLMLGALLAVLLERFKPRMHRVSEFEEMGLPVLHVMPVMRLPGTAQTFRRPQLSMK